jgi:transposase
MYNLQAPLFEFETFIQLDATNRLRLVLETLDVETFLVRLDARHRWVGRRGYGARTLWACLLAGVIYRIPTMAELRRHLQVSAELRWLCGLQRADRIPSGATFSRFLALLATHPEVLEAAFQDLVQRFHQLAPDFGQRLALDSTDIHAAANGHRRQPADPDARWGVKGLPGGKKDEKYRWFGYKLHLAVDARYELPVAFTVTAANAADCSQARPLIEQRDQRLFDAQLGDGVVAFPPLQQVMADAAYDSTEIYQAVLDRQAMPVIPLHQPSADKWVGITNGRGTPICPAGLPFTFWGRDGAYLKYRCPHYAQPHRLCCLKEHRAVSRCSTSPYGQVVKITIGADPRRHLPVPRESARWQALYDQRTSVERVNSRLKDRCLVDDLQVRGLPKVTVRLTLGLLVMLAAAVAMAERQRWKDIRRLAA